MIFDTTRGMPADPPLGETWGFAQMSNAGKGYWYKIGLGRCDDAGHGKWEGDSQEIPDGPGAKIGGRLDQCAVDTLQPHIDGQNRESQIGVNQCNNDGARSID